MERRPNFLLNSKGMSLVEVLVASVIVATAGLGLGAALQAGVVDHKKNNVISNAIGLESALNTAFSSPETISGYTSGSQVQLVGGFNGQSQLGLNYTNTATGAVTYFKDDFTTCSGFTAADCVMKVELSVRTFPGNSTGYAYRISINPSVASVAPLGGSQNPDGSEATDFSNNSYVMMPSTSSWGCTGTVCNTTSMNACDPNVHLAAYSVNLSTHSVSCLAKPLDCPADTPTTKYVAQGINVDAYYGTQLSCKGIRKARCPANYVLKRINTASLEGEAPDGECVFAAAVSASPPTPVYTGGSISGKLCPSGYRSQSTCTMINATAVNGANTNGTIAMAVPGSIDFRENGEYVVCRVLIPAQPGSAVPAQWSAQAQLSATCVLDNAVARLTSPTF